MRPPALARATLPGGSRVLGRARPSAAGAAVTYVEIDDLSHTYPRDLNRAVLRWLSGFSPHGETS